jgi:predicted PhzF superfamily epimerase YddE/YHI9
MMAELVAGLIDVFAQTPLSGNPLAVVEAADDLSDARMKRRNRRARAYGGA